MIFIFANFFYNFIFSTSHSNFQCCSFAILWFFVVFLTHSEMQRSYVKIRGKTWKSGMKYLWLIHSDSEEISERHRKIVDERYKEIH
jgi:hypothetical protein